MNQTANDLMQAMAPGPLAANYAAAERRLAEAVETALREEGCIVSTIPGLIDDLYERLFELRETAGGLHDDRFAAGARNLLDQRNMRLGAIEVLCDQAAGPLDRLAGMIARQSATATKGDE